MRITDTTDLYQATYGIIKPDTSLYPSDDDSVSRYMAMAHIARCKQGMIQQREHSGAEWVASIDFAPASLLEMLRGVDFRIAPEAQPMPEAPQKQAECMFVVGEHYKTRDGKDAKVLAVCAEAESFQIVSIIANVFKIHTITGSYFSHGEENGMDLMPRTKTVWVAQYHPACDSEAASQERYPSAIGHHAIQVNA